MDKATGDALMEGTVRRGLLRRIFRWIFRILLLGVLLVLVLVGVLPLLVSGFAGKAALEKAAGDNLASTFSVDRVSMDWTGGFGLEGLRIDQPEGFGAGPAVEVEKALLDVGLGKLISGIYKVGVEVRGLRVSVVRNAEGELNLLHLAKPAPPSPGKAEGKPAGGASAGEGSPLKHLLAWFRLEDAVIEFHDLSGGLSGKARLALSISNEKPGGPFHLEGKADVFTADGNPGGQVRLEGDLDPIARKGVLKIQGGKVALEAWKTLLPLGPEVRSIKGNLGLDLEVRLQEDKVQTRGKVEIRNLAARLAALGKGPLRQDLWTFHPDLSVDLEKKEVDFSKLRADAGPLRIQGLSSEEAARLLPGGKAAGTRITLDLDKLAALTGLLPPGAGAGGKLTITAALPEKNPSKLAFRLSGKDLAFHSKGLEVGPLTLDGEGGADVTKGLDGLRAVFTLKGKGLKAGENLVRDVLARFSLDKKALDLKLEKAEVNGGPAKGEISLRLGPKSVPLEASLHLDGASVNASLAPLLAYFIPFAVTPGDALLSGKAAVDTELAGEVPLEGGISVKRILRSLKGKGKLALQALTFQGSPELKQILAAFKAGNGYAFKGLSTSFRLDGGKIIQKEIDIPHGGSKIRISGYTDLAGNLDYSFDFGDLLKKNKKGKKILALLGGNTIPVKLGGTIFSPKPELKALDLKSLLGTGRQVLEKKAGEGLEKALEKGLKSLFGRKKKKKK